MQSFKQFAREKKTTILRTAAAFFAMTVIVLLLSQQAFAQTTYVITDGSRVLVHTTSSTDPEDVLGEAGLKLGEDDTFTTQAGLGTAEIQIQRSQRIRVNYYGKSMEVVSNGETVEQLLNRLELTWQPGDTFSLPMDTMTYDGMELTVSQVIRVEQTYSVTLAHEVHYCTDASLPVGSECVRTEGVDGEMRCTALVTYVNGVETERTVLSETVTRHPVDGLTAVGTGMEPSVLEQLPVITEDTIILPTGEVLTYDDVLVSLATAYCDKGRTATGTEARVGAIAVDPRVIPYGTRMFIMTLDGEYVYGIATAEDCGSKDHIYGTRIDLHMDTYDECRAFGARDCLVYFLS